MIDIGIKCGLSDFDDKKHYDNPSFFEIILGSRPDSRFRRIFDEISQMKKDCFIHLPSEFHAEDSQDRTLLNVSSSNSSVRRNSREIIERIIRETDVYSPAGWILHAPTMQNFSIKRGLFDKGSHEDLKVGLNWIKDLDRNILIENIPPAIRWDSRSYMTASCPFELLTANDIPLVLDTAHLHAAEPDPTEFIATIRALLSHILYIHVSTLKEEVPYDIHGNVFEATEPEYPSIELIDRVLEIIFKISQSVSSTIRLVCEPKEDPGMHLRNYQELKDRIDRLQEIYR